MGRDHVELIGGKVRHKYDKYHCIDVSQAPQKQGFPVLFPREGSRTDFTNKLLVEPSYSVLEKY